MELVYRLGWTLLQSLWQGAIIAAVLAVVLAALARRSAKTRYAALIAAMFAISVAFIVTFVCGPARDSSSPSPSAPIAATHTLLHPQATATSLAIGPAVSAFSVPPLQRPSERLNLSGSWTGLLRQNDWLCQTAGQTWLTGVLLLGAWRALAWFSVRRLVVLQSSPAEPTLTQTAQRLAPRLDLSKHFEILISCLAETPMVIGWLRPVILVPAAAITGLAPSQLEAILAHELAHIRRHDYLVNLLQILLETLLFYHPAIWWISRRIRLEREQACDDIAVSICGDRQAYARSLAAVEELRMVGSPALAAGGTGGKQMLLRIRRILRPMDAIPRWAFSGLISFLLIAVLGLVVCERMLADSPKDNSATTRPFKLQNDAPRLSPFTAVRWRGDLAEVQFKGTWYELVSINDLSTSKILAYLQDSKDFAPQKHFAEDLVEVMRDMGHQPGSTAKLELTALDTRQTITIPDAPMTEENRRSVLKAGNAPAAAPGGENDRPNPPAPPATGPGASDGIFNFDVPFQRGKTDFLDGDRITVTDVRGTSPDMESGICCISGTYKLTSHDQAMLGVFVAAADSSQGIGSYNAAQTVRVRKGIGTFTLLLPVNVKGWPHLSFYGEQLAPASQLSESVDVKLKDLNLRLQKEGSTLARERNELDYLAEKYGTADLQARDQQMQAQLSQLEANLQQVKIALGKNPGIAAALNERVKSLQKMVDQVRLEATEVGAQRQLIEDVRAQIAQIQAIRKRDLDGIKELSARQVLESGSPDPSHNSFGEIYIGTGDWVLRK